MRLSPRIMGKCGTASNSSNSSVVPFALFLLISCYCLSVSECKRSACWRYGHSCWGAHGKRSGGGSLGPSGSVELGPAASAGVESQGGSRQFGMLNKATGKFIPLPVLSMMLLHNRGSNILHPTHPHLLHPPHPPVGHGLREIGHNPLFQVSRPIRMKMKRNDQRNINGRDENNNDSDESVSSSQQQQDDYNTSGLGPNSDPASNYKSSKEDDPNRNGRQGEHESMDLNGDDSSSDDRTFFLDNSIFVRDRRRAPSGPTSISNSDDETNNSNESVSNAASEEHSPELYSHSSSTSSLTRQPHTQFFLDKMKSFKGLSRI